MAVLKAVTTNADMLNKNEDNILERGGDSEQKLSESDKSDRSLKLSSSKTERIMNVLRKLNFI